jgi:hypothetical protein
MANESRSSAMPMNQFVSRGRRKAPVKKVQLPHEEAAADVERQVQRRLVSGRHLHAAQRRVRALVDDLAHGGVEEEGQVRAGQQQDDEGVERDLAEQEGPVVGEDLVQGATQRAGDDQTVVDLQRRLAQSRGRDTRRCGGASHQMRSRFQ